MGRWTVRVAGMITVVEATRKGPAAGGRTLWDGSCNGHGPCRVTSVCAAPHETWKYRRAPVIEDVGIRYDAMRMRGRMTKTEAM